MSAQTNDVTPTAANATVVQEVRQSSSLNPEAASFIPLEDLTGEDDEYTIFKPLACDEAYPDWPEPQRHLPSSVAHHLLTDTSIDPSAQSQARLERPERRQPTDAERRAQQQTQQSRIQRRIEAQQMAEQEAREEAENEQRREAALSADIAGAELQAHQRAQVQLVAVYESARQRWVNEEPDAAEEFETHRTHARVVAGYEEVRYYDILCWFKHATHSVLLPLRAVARSFREEARLAVVLNRYERAEQNGVPRLSLIQQETAAGAEAAIARGTEAPCHGNSRDPYMQGLTIGTFKPPECDTQEQEAELVRAMFEIRAVRLDHENDPRIRWPQRVPFEDTLDYSVELWCQAAYGYYIDENDQYRRAFNDDLAQTLMEIRAYGAQLR